MFGESIHDDSLDRDEARKFKNYEDLLFFGLYSIKSGLTYDLLGLIFDLSPSNIHAKQGLVLSVLQSAVEQGGSMPKRVYHSDEEFIKGWNKEASICAVTRNKFLGSFLIKVLTVFTCLFWFGSSIGLRPRPGLSSKPFILGFIIVETIVVYYED